MPTIADLRRVLRDFDGWLDDAIAHASDHVVADDEDRALWCVDQLSLDINGWQREAIARIILDERGWDEYFDGEDEYIERLWDWESDSEFARIAGRIAAVLSS
jgi:hypothetical protein